MHVMPEAVPIHAQSAARPLTLPTSWPAVPTSPGASLVTPMHVPASSTAEPLDMLPSTSLCQADRPDGAPYWPTARAHGTLAPSAAYSHSADFNFPGSVATSSPAVVANISAPSPQALTPGGFLVPPKLAQRIWKGNFIDMYELLPEKLGRSEEISSQDLDGTKRKRRKVTSALQWVECFHTYIGVIAQQQPGRVTDLLAYASLIVHAARKFKGEGWLQYDKFFRKYAEVHPGIRWAEANASLWTLAFCGAQPHPHCELCFSVDHESQNCEEYVPPDEPPKKKPAISEQPYRAPYSTDRRPICINWNRRSCSSSTCNYQHICIECHQRHREKDCPVVNGRQFSGSTSRPRRGREREDQSFRNKGAAPH